MTLKFGNFPYNSLTTKSVFTNNIFLNMANKHMLLEKLWEIYNLVRPQIVPNYKGSTLSMLCYAIKLIKLCNITSINSESFTSSMSHYSFQIKK